ncbi:MAG: protealysin inhibitor emfourin [Gemmataceae bacterium]
MRIRFESGGGVTGPAGNRSAAFDTDRLPPTEAAELQSLVRGANLPALAKRPAATTRPDEIYYELTVEVGGRSETVSATQRDAPPELRPLIAWLNAHAAPGR